VRERVDPANRLIVGAQPPAALFNTILPAYLAAASERIQGLTERQITVMLLIAAGYDNRTVAYHLGISEATVKQYVTAILGRLGVKSRLQIGLIGLAARAAGLISRPVADFPEPPRPDPT
jgi:DNA-binding NarL/FixJ family response regulator